MHLQEHSFLPLSWGTSTIIYYLTIQTSSLAMDEDWPGIPVSIVPPSSPPTRRNSLRNRPRNRNSNIQHLQSRSKIIHNHLWGEFTQ